MCKTLAAQNDAIFNEERNDLWWDPDRAVADVLLTEFVISLLHDHIIITCNIVDGQLPNFFSRRDAALTG